MMDIVPGLRAGRGLKRRAEGWRDAITQAAWRALSAANKETE